MASTHAHLDDSPLVGYWFDRTKEYYARRKRIQFEKYDFLETVRFPRCGWRSGGGAGRLEAGLEGRRATGCCGAAGGRDQSRVSGGAFDQ
jgi:hypothetical protein